MIKSTITKHTSQGKNVVLVMHSYGGAPGQQAVGELLKEGKLADGKVVTMAWVAAFAFVEGGSLKKMLGGNDLPWFDVNVRRTASLGLWSSSSRNLTNFFSHRKQRTL